MTIDPIALGLLGLVLLFAGLCAGVLAGLLGVGGGIVIVPVLFNLFGFIGIDDDVTMHLAVGTSLASIIPTSISSVRAHLARGAVDRDLLRGWAPGVASGVVLGTVLAGVARGELLTAVFATVALVVALHMSLASESLRLSDHPPRGVIKVLVSGLIGTFSSMMGIGGGTLTVPTLVLCNYPIRRAVATSSALGLIIAVPGTIGFIASGWGNPELPPLSVGYVNLLGLVLTTPTAMLAAPVGARMAHSINPRSLRLAFAGFLALTSLRMFYGLLS